VFGLFTRFAALAVVIFMINAVWFTSAKGFFWTNGGMEFSLLILVVALVFMVRGGGNLSIDEKMGREL
jgi:putative oxidoreductase